MTTAASLDASPEEERAPGWMSRNAFPAVLLSLFATQGMLAAALWHDEPLWLTIPLLLLTSHFMHGLLIGFHEASHGMLRRNRLINEIDGVLLGLFSLMSFSLYRAAHQTHHMHLATEKDEELWPFVHPSSPRWWRVLAAFLELFAGMIFTPALFLRTFFRPGSPIRSRKVRRRVWMELILIAVVWSAILAVVALAHTTRYFLWLYLGPGWLAANLQSWRKYIEHVGMAGCTPSSATRSIVAPGPWGRLVAFTLLHEPYHGVHHQHAGLPHPELPRRAALLNPRDAGDLAPFASYRHALSDLLGKLADPKVGSQWRDEAGLRS